MGSEAARSHASRQHTAAVGFERYNRELPLARADAVRAVLAVYGRSARIHAEGRGDAEPRG
jgi:outer membrane protein OmpA-like peptidoglycan-associated protein